ncbi:MAG: hypothetical protein IKK57_04170 [Clostridia bacterium]|nr:hypothetical protein [Clostridia bacterium]
MHETLLLIALVQNKKPLSPAESGAKALGESEKRFPPVPLCFLVSWSRGCDPGRLGLKRIALNVR